MTYAHGVLIASGNFLEHGERMENPKHVVHGLVPICSMPSDQGFWQVLVTCSSREFLEFGERFLAGAELRSPGLRIVVCLSDHNDKALKLLYEIGDKLKATSVLYLRHGYPSDIGQSGLALSSAAWLLQITRLAVFSLPVNAQIQKALHLLPVSMEGQPFVLKALISKKGKGETLIIWARASARNSRRILRMQTLLSIRDSAVSEGGAWEPNLPNRGSFPAELFGSGPDKEPAVELEIALDFDRRRTVSATEQLAKEPDTYVLFPRQDLGTKAPLQDNSYEMRVRRLSKAGRQHWFNMARVLYQQAINDGLNPRILPISQWEISAKLLASLGNAKRIYVSHMLREQLNHPAAVFYMQEMLPSVFTVGKNGWGSKGDGYGSTQFLNEPAEERLEQFKTEFSAGRITKAPQNGGASGQPMECDVLAPLQVPEDEALTFHGICTLDTYVETLAEYAVRTGKTVCFRKHPLDRTAYFDQVKARYSKDRNIRFSKKGHIHDAIRGAKSVAVINSGVGFEAMLLGKPVVCFGRAIYEAAGYLVSDDGFDSAMDRALAEPMEQRIERYDRFLSWFLYKVAWKLDETVLNFNSDRLAEPQFKINPCLDSSLQPAGNSNVASRSFLSRAKRKASKKVIGTVEQRIWKPVLEARKAFWLPRLAAKRKPYMKPFDPASLEGKRVALVGNAASLLTTRFGEEIDSHDIVIRMNLGYPFLANPRLRSLLIPEAYIEGFFTDRRSRDYEQMAVLRADAPSEVLRHCTNIGALGRRTDIWSCSTADQNRQLFFAPLFNCTTVACHPSHNHLSMELVKSRQVEELSDSTYHNLRSGLGIEPSSGLIWIDYLRTTGLQTLSIYGFDFFSTAHAVRKTVNQLEARGVWPHAPDVEQAYVTQTLLPADERIRLVNSNTPREAESGAPAHQPENA
ncbi:hypothetical protein E1162_04435 [Rhodobacteraceae bacterium RKSG542]|uniref:glycosyltransferase family 29 protein n=1 Tax=Pseudovibrio flavus TaxID=2529854 RepID=UPI0012BC36C5|nr:glycosyltransferase family 29 protein [Pseudovibrio flavus]MTI16485.1 hypothetical protein [Pseudovibrio flavus]